MDFKIGVLVSVINWWWSWITSLVHWPSTSVYNMVGVRHRIMQVCQQQHWLFIVLNSYIFVLMCSMPNNCYRVFALFRSPARSKSVEKNKRGPKENGSSSSRYVIWTRAMGWWLMIWYTIFIGSWGVTFLTVAVASWLPYQCSETAQNSLVVQSLYATIIQYVDMWPWHDLLL